MSKSKAGLRLRLLDIVLQKSLDRRQSYTHAELADLAEVRRPTITEWMNPDWDIEKLEIRVLMRLAKALKVHPSEILDWYGIDWLDEEDESPPKLKTEMIETSQV